MSRVPLRVAVLGAGTVGREVVRGLLDDPQRLCASDGAPLILAGVASRDLARARASGVPADLLTDAPAHLVAAPDIDVIVELMGGDEPARTLIAAALGAGKPVVTANKHVVAHHGPDLEAVARSTGAPFRFEAAVAGGIPILGLVASDLAANAISRIRGIVNGTSNYILSAMSNDRQSYAEVLAAAQALGYAEADPTGDVEGDDAVNKLVILARLAFGQWLDPRTVGRRPPTVRGSGRPGITGVTDLELDGAAAIGLAIKLLASAMEADGRVAAAVLPTAVPSGSAFALTNGVTNRIEIEAQPLGMVALSGPGAGGAATSSAVLGDLIAVGRGLSSTWAGLEPATGPAAIAVDPLDAESGWYAFVPGVVIDQATSASWPGLTIARIAGGMAIATEPMTLEGARGAVGMFLAPGADATLYPIDD